MKTFLIIVIALYIGFTIRQIARNEIFTGSLDDLFNVYPGLKEKVEGMEGDPDRNRKIVNIIRYIICGLAVIWKLIIAALLIYLCTLV